MRGVIVRRLSALGSLAAAATQTRLATPATQVTTR